MQKFTISVTVIWFNKPEVEYLTLTLPNGKVPTLGDFQTLLTTRYGVELELVKFRLNEPIVYRSKELTREKPLEFHITRSTMM